MRPNSRISPPFTVRFNKDPASITIARRFWGTPIFGEIRLDINTPRSVYLLESSVIGLFIVCFPIFER